MKAFVCFVLLGMAVAIFADSATLGPEEQACVDSVHAANEQYEIHRKKCLDKYPQIEGRRTSDDDTAAAIGAYSICVDEFYTPEVVAERRRCDELLEDLSLEEE